MGHYFRFRELARRLGLALPFALEANFFPAGLLNEARVSARTEAMPPVSATPSANAGTSVIGITSIFIGEDIIYEPLYPYYPKCSSTVPMRVKYLSHCLCATMVGINGQIRGLSRQGNI